MIRHEITATYRSCRGAEPCDRCLEDPNNVRHIIAYGRVEDAEEAEKLLYEHIFRAELDAQNEAYRKRGNYGRIWTMDEWRKSVRHRPIESVLQIGNEKNCLPVGELYDVYRNFFAWRMENFGDIFALVSASIYVGYVPHIHERYVLYWTDEEGVKHTGIDNALEQIGIGLPFGESEGESRYNNRKMMFDRICREKWLDLVEEKIKGYPELELKRPDPRFKHQIKIDREFRLASGDHRALSHASYRNYRKITELRDKIGDMAKELEEIYDDMETGAVATDDMDALRERMLVLKNKISECKKRLKKAEKKYKDISKTINEVLSS